MSDKNLLIGGTTYPHTKTPLQIRRELNDAKFDKFFGFPTSDKSQVSSVSCKLFVDHVLRESDERIEQLERQLADAKIGHARYEYVRKLNVPQFRELYLSNLHGDQTFDDRIDADINGVKA